MSNLQILSPNSNRVQAQELLATRTPELIKSTHFSERPHKGSGGANYSQNDLNNGGVSPNNPQTSIINTKEGTEQKGSVLMKTETGQLQSSNTQRFFKPETSINRGRPKSSRPATLRASFVDNSTESPPRSLNNSVATRTGESHSYTIENIQQVPFTKASNNNKRTASRLSLLSSSAEDRENVIINPNQRAVSCDSLLPRRSRSNQSKYHESCFPKEDPALIIGSPYRIQSARDRREKSAHKRPSNRHRHIQSEFTNRESVVNIVYTAQSETEQDELGRARAETERDARALRSGGLSSGSFSQGFFHQTKRWAYPAPRQRRVFTHYSHQHNMAGALGASCEYPTVQEDDCSTSRYSYSRQSCSPHSDDMDGTTLTVPGLPIFRPASQRSLLSSSRQTDSPQSESGQPQRTSSFLYQMVAFDNLADNVPTFVRQNVKKTGRMQTESFILRLNYLRRRRALGETSGTINNNAMAKASVAATSTASGGGGTSPRTG